ncbi:MAG: hypothetical protein JJ863_38545 [Deltaproteobacteria bacterium]|nr:hypothetical protein [Deltaproteobacteria bacterium]
MTRRGQLNPEMAAGAFWRQVRRIAGELGWLTVGKRELEELARERHRQERPRSRNWFIGRKRDGKVTHAFLLSFRVDSGFRFERVDDLSNDEKTQLEELLSTSRWVGTGGETSEGIQWDGRTEVFPGTAEHLNACLFELRSGLQVMASEPAVSFEETVRRVEKNWAVAAAHEEGLIIRRTYRLEGGAEWPHHLHASAEDFRRSFATWPNIMLASQSTYEHMEKTADHGSVRSDEGDNPEPGEHPMLSSFVNADYELEMAIDDELELHVAVLLFDAYPHADEPVPEEDTPTS